MVSYDAKEEASPTHVLKSAKVMLHIWCEDNVCLNQEAVDLSKQVLTGSGTDPQACSDELGETSFRVLGQAAMTAIDVHWKDAANRLAHRWENATRPAAKRNFTSRLLRLL